MNIHDNIKSLRALRGISQSEMADYLEMDLSNYNKLENGRTMLKWDQVVDISKQLDVSVVELITFNPRAINFEEPKAIYKTREALKECKEKLQVVEKLNQELLIETVR